MKHHLTTLSKELNKKETQIFNTSFIKELPKLLESLGEKDPTLRDDLAHKVLSSYFQDKRFPKEKRLEIIDLLLSTNFLFIEIEKGETDLSVKRTFSLLALTDLIWGDYDAGGFLNADYMTNLSKNLRDYLLKEKDFRGYDKKIGWVHAYAHAGDLLVAINGHHNTTPKEIYENIKFTLNLIELREFNVFKWDEHARLATSIAAGIERLKENQQILLFENYTSAFLLNAPSRQNLLNTLRSLYVELHTNKFKNEKLFERLREIIF